MRTGARGAKHVLWLDPGITTGWALYYLRERQLVQGELGFDELVVWLDRWLSTASSSTIVGCERFVLTTESSRRPGSIEAIQAWGAARSAASRHGAAQFLDHQTSSAALSFCRDETLRALDWYRLGMDHANDAARHVYRWLANEGLLTASQKSKMFSD